MAAAEQEFAALRGEADDHVERMRAVADRVSLEGRLAAQRELDQAMSDAEKLCAEAQEVATRLLEQARAKAAKETAEVAEQGAWTQQMVAGLREAAELDARERHDAHAEAAALTARVRHRLIDCLMASRRVLHERQVEAMGLRMDAYQQLDDARRDAERTRGQASPMRPDRGGWAEAAGSNAPGAGRPRPRQVRDRCAPTSLSRSAAPSRRCSSCGVPRRPRWPSSCSVPAPTPTRHVPRHGSR